MLIDFYNLTVKLTLAKKKQNQYSKHQLSFVYKPVNQSLTLSTLKIIMLTSDVRTDQFLI